MAARYLIIDKATSGRVYASLGSEAVFGRHEAAGRYRTPDEWLGAEAGRADSYEVLGPFEADTVPDGGRWNPATRTFDPPAPEPTREDRLDRILAALQTGGMSVANRARVRDAILAEFPDRDERLKL